MIFLRYIVLLSLGVSALKISSFNNGKLRWTPPEPVLNPPYGHTCNLLDSVKAETCLQDVHRTPLYRKPITEEITKYFNSSHPFVIQCARFSACLHYIPCARTFRYERDMNICHLYRMVVEEMLPCFIKIKKVIGLREWNAERFVGVAGYFRQQFRFSYDWLSTNAYHPFNCNELRQHLRRFKKLITENCFVEMWEQYYKLVQYANTFKDLCLLDNINE